MIIDYALKLWDTVETTLFPPVYSYKRPLTGWTYVLIVGVLTLLFSSIGFVITPNGIIGYDWFYYFSTGSREFLPFYPPWVVYVRWLTWPGLIGLSCAGLVVALYQRGAVPLVIGSAFVSLPFLWLVFLGQVDGLALLGLTYLPWLAPLALLKPSISVFAFMVSKRLVITFIVLMLVTMAIWGLWPLDMLSFRASWQNLYEGANQPQDISLWPWSVPLVLILLWLSRGDMDMLMLAGTFATPHLIPYSYVIVLPAIARVKPGLAVLLVAISWLPLAANWVGDWGWQLGHLFAAILWITLYRQRLQQTKRLHPQNTVAALKGSQP